MAAMARNSILILVLAGAMVVQLCSLTPPVEAAGRPLQDEQGVGSSIGPEGKRLDTIPLVGPLLNNLLGPTGKIDTSSKIPGGISKSGSLGPMLGGLFSSTGKVGTSSKAPGATGSTTRN